MAAREMGVQIRARRKRLLLTQEDVADLAGVSRRLVSEVERAAVSVTLSNLIAICDAVGLDVVSRPRYPEDGP